jgi:HSP20 family protein
MSESNCCAPAAPAATDVEEVFAKPTYRSVREEHDYRVEVLLPGVGRGDVKVAVEDYVLTVTGVRRKAVPENWRALHEELAKPNYRLQLRLHKDIDESRIGATVENGVLTLVLPVREAAKPRTISVA